MADIDDSTNMDNAKDKAKDMASRHPMRLSVAAMAAVFGTGYLLGHRQAESQNPYNKLKKQLSSLR